MTDRHAARRAAVEILGRVVEERQQLSDQMAEAGGPLAGLLPPQRAEAQRLALDTLRRIGPADKVMQPFLKRQPSPEIVAILRLAVVELAQRPDAAHGIVGAAVDLARETHASGAAAGFVNAVLRKVAGAAAEQMKEHVQGLPGWLRRRLAAAYGKDTVAAMEMAHLTGAPVDLTLRDLQDADLWAGRLDATILPSGSLRLTSPAQISAMPGYAEGAWWVQDAAAALPARMTGAGPGQRVLDLCAAPGGKTLQLAAAGADVTALDISEHRMARVAENLHRCDLKAKLTVADALEWRAEGFDAILLDAPCSATGTIRRHPDLPFVKRPGDLAGLVALQAALIDRAVALLKPGGALVYCTCSLLPEEGEAQLADALERHPGLKLEPALPAGVPASWTAGGGGIRTRPDYWTEHGGVDGFFMARLRKAG